MADLSEVVKTLFEAARRLDTFADTHVALIGAEIISGGLRVALKANMRPLSKNEEERIFGGRQALGDVAGRIEVAHALRIIPPEMYGQLKAMNRLRVEFAHATKVRHFGDPDLAAAISSFKGLDAELGNFRAQYLKLISEIGRYLGTVAKEAEARQLKEFPDETRE